MNESNVIELIKKVSKIKSLNTIKSTCTINDGGGLYYLEEILIYFNRPNLPSQPEFKDIILFYDKNNDTMYQKNICEILRILDKHKFISFNGEQIVIGDNIKDLYDTFSIY